MSSERLGTIEEQPVFHFRDRVLYARTQNSRIQYIERIRQPPVSRKGNQLYAKEIADILANDPVGSFGVVLIVGDGAGDVHLSRKFRAEILKRKFDWEVHGLFIGHDDYGRAMEHADSGEFFPTWKDLASRIDDLCESERRVAVLVDIDRTAILPRLLADEAFYAIRDQAVTEYVQGFRIKELSAAEMEHVLCFIGYVSKHLRSYTHPDDSICFKNEESVAIAVLLCATGLIGKKWISAKPRAELSELLSYGLHRVEEGFWAAGLGETNAYGAVHWDVSLLERHLAKILQSLSDRRPIISFKYRQLEAPLIARASENVENFFNESLLAAISQKTNARVFFLSDRPGVSLGLQGAGVNQGIMDIKSLALIGALIAKVL